MGLLKRSVLTTSCFLISLCLQYPIDCYSQTEQLAIKDSSGITRAASQVDGVSKIEFTVISASGDTAENVAVTLTNTLTGETVTELVSNGAVVFDGITPGVWTVTSAPGVTFTNVAIASSALAGGIAGVGAGTLLTVGGAGIAATGAAVAIDEATDDSSDDEDPPLSPFS